VQLRLEQVYRDHRQGLFTLALAITRSADLAEDAVQEAFARLWRSAREPTGDFVAYVFASVRNAALEFARRQRRSVAVPASLFDGTRSDPAGPAIAAEREQLVRAAVDALPIRQRQTVVLRLYAGLTFQQIADSLHEPLPTVASRYRRALQRIKDSLEKLI
jgi:RNA polymerase sigma-70 factor (ECF subfamily)